MSINLDLIVNSTIFIHTPGMFTKGSDLLMTNNYVEKGKMHLIDINYEIRELLDYGGDPCNTDKIYQMDGCYSKATEKIALATVGCTTPYAFNKTNICTDDSKGEAALDIYDMFMFADSENYEGCYYPCSYFIVSSKDPVSYSTDSALISVYLHFHKLIQETKTQYTYSGLSLIAEIGGYVGLFIGVSLAESSIAIISFASRIIGKRFNGKRNK